VIVDEEQRFGVAHKERLKQLRTDVDVLSMSATPIPRTLEMAVSGIRDLSVIETPPEDRQPVHTVVAPFDDAQAALAVRRELLRDGQVFYVHNQVDTIHAAASHLAELVPDARIEVAHGTDGRAQLERVMVRFWKREFDVLVSTTIIESGLDVPNANTLDRRARRPARPRAAAPAAGPRRPVVGARLRLSVLPRRRVTDRAGLRAAQDGRRAHPARLGSGDRRARPRDPRRRQHRRGRAVRAGRRGRLRHVRAAAQGGDRRSDRRAGRRGDRHPGRPADRREPARALRRGRQPAPRAVQAHRRGPRRGRDRRRARRARRPVRDAPTAGGAAAGPRGPQGGAAPLGNRRDRAHARGALRIAPVQLRDSQQVRLQRLFPGHGSSPSQQRSCWRCRDRGPTTSSAGLPRACASCSDRRGRW
jgi:hypothetical protein